MKKKKLGLPGIDVEAPEQKNAMMAGQFEVILELLEKYSEGDQGKIAKAQVSLNIASPEATSVNATKNEFFKVRFMVFCGKAS